MRCQRSLEPLALASQASAWSNWTPSSAQSRARAPASRGAEFATRVEVVTPPNPPNLVLELELSHRGDQRGRLAVQMPAPPPRCEVK
jgi:hypothetical protein